MVSISCVQFELHVKYGLYSDPYDPKLRGELRSS